MRSLRSALHKSIAFVSDKLVYHRFMDKPLTFFQDGLKRAIHEEVDRIELVMNGIGEKKWLDHKEFSKFNQYGAFICRDLVNKELFNINDYADSPLYAKIAHSSLKSNFSPDVQRICLDIKHRFEKLSPEYRDETDEQALFDHLIPILLMKFFEHEDTYKLYQNYVYAIAATLVFRRKNYQDIQTAESVATKTLITDFLFEVLNNSIHVYSYNFYSLIYRYVPISMQCRMATPKLKFKLIKNEEYSFVMKREFQHIPLFRRTSGNL